MPVFLPVLITMIPLAILPVWSFYFDVVPKVTLTAGAAAIALLFTDVPRKGWQRRTKLFLALLTIQGAVALAGTALSRHPARSFFGSIWRKDGLMAEWSVLVLAAATCCFLSVDPARVRLFLRITVLGSLPAAAYGILQYFGVDAWLPSAAYHFGEGKFQIVRPPSTLGHAAYFATYLTYSLFAGFALRGLETSRAWRTLALSVTLVSGFAIVLSGTRAAMIASIAAAALMLARQGFTKQRMFRWTAIGAAALVLLGVFYFSPAGGGLRAREYWSHDDPLGGSRLLLWRDSLRMASAHPLRGYGLESFVVEFPAYESIELARAYPDFYHESPHNIFLDALVSSGGLGFATLIAIAIFGIYFARGAMGAAFVAILISQQFTAFTVPPELYFYICLAVLAAQPMEAPKAVQRRLPLRWAIAAPFACFSVYLAIGDATLASARRALDRDEVAAASKDLARAREWHATADIYFSQRLLAEKSYDPAARLRNWRSGLDAAREAPASADDPMNAFVNLAAFDAGMNDAASVERDLRAASATAPNWYKPHLLLARVLAVEGRTREAEMEAQAACDRGGPKPFSVTTR
jgi:O-antigen ligase